MTLQGTHTEDNLVAGHFPRITKEVTILAGQSLSRGAVLGKITVGGKYQHTNSGLVNGAEVADAVLSADVDASLADTKAIVYRSGQFNKNQMSVAAAPTGSDTVEAHENEMRLRSIFIEGAALVGGTIN